MIVVIIHGGKLQNSPPPPPPPHRCPSSYSSIDNNSEERTAHRIQKYHREFIKESGQTSGSHRPWSLNSFVSWFSKSYKWPWGRLSLYGRSRVLLGALLFADGFFVLFRGVSGSRVGGFVGFLSIFTAGAVPSLF